jgi:phage terminase large subunit-like protein
MALDFSCPDWADRLSQGRVPFNEDLPVDAARADQAAAIFDNLRLPDVVGQPRIGDSGGEWFRKIVRLAFGAVDPLTNTSAIGEIFCQVPKKNGKTTYTAALGITALLMNELPGVEIYVVSATKDGAATCFNQIANMIKADRAEEEGADPFLPVRFHINDGDMIITDRKTRAALHVKSFSLNVLTGKIPLMVIVDELHLLGKLRQAEGVLTQLRGGMITRDNSLLVMITTQSDEPPAGVYKTELDYARRVRDGTETQAEEINTLVCIYEFPEALQISETRAWENPDHWHMVTPNLGASITIPRLKRLFHKARSKGPEHFRKWASQHLNIQIGLALHGDRWIGVDHWTGCTRAEIDLAFLLEHSEVITAGIDGGGLDDLMALALVGRHRETGDWLTWARAWAHPEVMDRRKDIVTRLEEFAAAGDLVVCENPTQDIEQTAALCAQVLEAGLFPEAHGIGLDPYGVQALLTELNAHGMEGDLLASVGQGTRLSPVVWGLERKLKDQTLIHGGQGLLNWAVSNARAEQRGNAVLITKQASGKAKIDPVVAVFNAAMLMGRNPQAASVLVSPWDDPDFRLTKGAA